MTLTVLNIPTRSRIIGNLMATTIQTPVGRLAHVETLDSHTAFAKWKSTALDSSVGLMVSGLLSATFCSAMPSRG
jgi:hypothetical protein